RAYGRNIKEPLWAGFQVAELGREVADAVPFDVIRCGAEERGIVLEEPQAGIAAGTKQIPNHPGLTIMVDGQISRSRRRFADHTDAILSGEHGVVSLFGGAIAVFEVVLFGPLRRLVGFPIFAPLALAYSIFWILHPRNFLLVCLVRSEKAT